MGCGTASCPEASLVGIGISLAAAMFMHAQAFLALAPPLVEALGSPATREEAAASLRAVMAVMAANVLVDVAITALFGWS
jgi:hypothetical protein